MGPGALTTVQPLCTEVNDHCTEGGTPKEPMALIASRASRQMVSKVRVSDVPPLSIKCACDSSFYFVQFLYLVSC